MTKTTQIQYLPNLRSKHYKITLTKPNSLRFSNNTKSLPPISLKLLVLILLIFFSNKSSTCNQYVPIIKDFTLVLTLVLRVLALCAMRLQCDIKTNIELFFSKDRFV